ncbi:MAG TPA: hypothetical protein VLF66_03505 [Thermoanaerobaculia bacterium]|nr:hypothetical protein [Thermoanaerobaculia bacterium]
MTLPCLGVSVASFIAGVAGGVQNPGLPRLVPELAETGSGELAAEAARRATVVYVLGRQPPHGPGPGYRLDVTDRRTVRRLAEELARSAPTSRAAPEREPPYALLFASDAGKGGILTSFRYDPGGGIEVGADRRRYRASRGLQEALNPLIDEHRSLLEARDRFLQAVAHERWTEVEESSSPDLSARLRATLLPTLERHDLTLPADRHPGWRESLGVRRQRRSTGGIGARSEQAVRGFVTRLRRGDRGPSWWLHVLLVREPDRWRVEDLKLKRSGSKHGSYR